MLNKLLLPSIVFLFLIKIIALKLTTFNLFGDEAQYWLWSKTFDFGYFSKPPFLSWVIGVYSAVFGDSFFSLKLIPILSYLLVTLSVYHLSKNVGLEKNEAIS